MPTRSKRAVLPLIAIVVVIGSFHLPAAQAHHQWGDFHWSRPADTSAHRHVVVWDSTKHPWTNYLAGQASRWAAAADVHLATFDAEDDIAFRKECSWPDRARRVRVCSFQYGLEPDEPCGRAERWMGCAQIRQDTNGHIVFGRIRLNGSYYVDNGGTLTNDGVQHVICMELGHVLGIDHWNADGNGSCMNEANWNNGLYDQPAPHDIAQVDAQTCSPNAASADPCAHAHDAAGASVAAAWDEDPLDLDVNPCEIVACLPPRSIPIEP